jgi:transmembrane sensor
MDGTPMTHIPSDSSPIDAAALDRYLAGEAPADEAQQVARALDEIPALRQVASALTQRDNRSRLADDTDTRLAAIMGGAQRLSGPVWRIPRAHRWLFAGTVTAAIAAAFIFGGARHTTELPSRRYSTAAAERKVITLDDGSTITLAPNSSLGITRFSGGERRVTLEGQGYFAVAPVSNAPFVVRTGTIATTVLGTAFTVKRYSGDRAVQVAVMQGKVSVGRDGASMQSVTLSAGDMVYADDSVTRRVPVENIRDYDAWTKGALVFRGIPVSEMLRTVGAWYGYDFKLADSTLMRQHVNAELQFQSADAMFKALRQLLGVRMMFDGRVVTLVPEPKASVMPRARHRGDSVLSTSTEMGR